MSEIDEITRLENELRMKKESLRTKQDRCTHEWTDVKYDPEHYKKPIFSHYAPHGSDPVPIYNYVSTTKDRWSRTCKKCGKVEYTYEKKATKYEPYFG